MLRKKQKRIDNSENKKIYFWSLLFVFFFCLFSYGFLVRGAIVNIVARQNMENDLTALSTKVIDLESKYIKVKNNITLERAYALGFGAVSEQKFVLKNVKTPGLSLLTQNN